MSDHGSDERFDFGFSEDESHDKIVNILVFEQFSIGRPVKLL